MLLILRKKEGEGKKEWKLEKDCGKDSGGGGGGGDKMSLDWTPETSKN